MLRYHLVQSGGVPYLELQLIAMNLTDTAFIELLAARSLTVQAADKAAVESLRIMLYRKLQAHIKQWDDVGYLADDLRDATISMKMEKDGKTATLSVIKRKPRLQFTILSTDSGTPDHEKVSTNLEHNQDCQIQQRSADHDPQGHGADTGSGSAEGESNGQRSSPEDWESVVRAFVEQNSDSQDEA